MTIGLLTAVVAAILLYLLLRSGLALRLAADSPNQRSLHTKITPRVGGMAVFSVAFAIALYAEVEQWQLPLAGLALLVLSFADDRFGLPIAVRFFAHALLAVMTLVFYGGFTGAAVMLLTLLLVWGTNLYNFMDGSDGLAGGMSVIGFSAYVIAAPTMPGLMPLAVCLVTASAAFLLFNFPPARVFMGDSGSIPLGFLAATMGVLGWSSGAWAWWFPILVFSPFFLDATVTLLRRMLRGERFWQAHREHYYQRLVRMGWSHRRLALVEYALMLGSAGAALWLQRVSTASQVAGLAAFASIYLVLMVLIDRRWCNFTRMDSHNA